MEVRSLVRCPACGRYSGIVNSFILVKQLKCTRCQGNAGKHSAFDQEIQQKTARTSLCSWKRLRILIKIADKKKNSRYSLVLFLLYKLS